MRKGYRTSRIMSSEPDRFLNNIVDSTRKCLNHSIKNNNNNVELVVETLCQIEYLLIDIGSSEHNLQHILRICSLEKKKLTKSIIYSISLANRGNLWSYFVFDALREFGEAIRNLLIGNYPSTYRSLRWIIESFLFLSDMQSDNWRIREAVDNFYEKGPYSRKEFTETHRIQLGFYEGKIGERLILKEKWRKFSASDMLDSNKIIKLSPVFSIKKSVLELYKSLSGFHHISEMSLIEYNKDTLRSNFGIFSHGYDGEEFEFSMDSIWETLDYFFLVSLLNGKYFYEYEKFEDYLILRKNTPVTDFVTFFTNNNLDKKMNNSSSIIKKNN